MSQPEPSTRVPMPPRIRRGSRRARLGAIAALSILALAAIGCEESSDDTSGPGPTGQANVVLQQLITEANLMASYAGTDAAVALNEIDPWWAITVDELRTVEDQMCASNSTGPLEEFAWSRLPGAGPEVLPILDVVLVEAMQRCQAGDAVSQQMAFLQTIADQRAQQILDDNEHADQNRQICGVLDAAQTLGADNVAAALAKRLGVTVPAVVFMAVMSTCPNWIDQAYSIASGVVDLVT